MSMELVKSENVCMVKLTPPQTLDAGIGPTKGAYVFVVDVSGR